MSQPNILVFFTDQQRADSCGCYGQPAAVTPTLDALAADGLRCDQTFTPNPVCGPARASLQTGCYPSSTGNHQNGTRLPPDYDTVAKLLGAHGYFCGHLGKWHLASTRDDPYRTRAVPPQLRGGYNDAWLASESLEWTSHGYGGYLFDEAGEHVHFSDDIWRGDFMTDRLLDMIDQASTSGKPFHLVASYLEPHHQNDHNAYEPPKELADQFESAPIPGDLAGLNGNWDKHYANYLACCHGLDLNLKKVVDHLTKRGLMDNTLIIFTSDHGCHFATRNGEYKRSCHDASLRIPLVLRGPGFRGGQVSTNIANLCDIPATILRAADVSVPNHWHGRPLQDLDNPNWRTRHLAQLSEAQVGRAIRTPDWTYSVRIPGKPSGPNPMHAEEYVEDLLYDNRHDPHQLTNLILDPQFEVVRADLRRQLLEEMQAIGEPPAAIIPAAGPGPNPVLGCAAANIVTGEPA